MIPTGCKQLFEYEFALNKTKKSRDVATIRIICIYKKFVATFPNVDSIYPRGKRYIYFLTIELKTIDWVEISNLKINKFLFHLYLEKKWHGIAFGKSFQTNSGNKYFVSKISQEEQTMNLVDITGNTET